ncbi:MAG: hypothetical protein A2927_02375 [Candidatus Komeilibacteria bacterium RIFCSPLOWO2_01_FULL_45_10]|uniref:Nudix hydrolase domain-containing protein n=1 Tax=Candidatus Komeilibacteria bacterium RIFCSPLOWO2_01_FULL_45_10 TaxID=1798550 RepID=A0A1G2BIU1_9BACT|nr:MAG: hypothetical protein A2927_02375 [Candidatus Komeilibacteria bacterium RIFCSPLOWO2_01_FULL_45_10]
MEEYFDIVDENNKQTGEKRLRFEAHTLGLWHRTVHIYFFRQKDNQIEFLVHLRSKYKDLHPNCWDTRFGGHLKSGETIEKTVINEIKEELGLEIDLNSLIKGSVHKRDKKTNREFTQVYYYKFDDNLKLLSFKDKEVQKVKWMAAADIIISLTNNPDEWSSSLKGFKEILGYLVKYLDR